MTTDRVPPSDVMKDVFGNPQAMQLLLRLGRGTAPLRYSDLRRELSLHPQEFQRALDRLEQHALVGYRSGGAAPGGRGKRAYISLIEATGLGRAYIAYARSFTQLAERYDIPAEA